MTGNSVKIGGRNILVTGAGGFIGSHLTDTLVKQGAHVKAFLRYRSDNSVGLLARLSKNVREEVEIFRGDLKDPEALRKPVRRCDLVFHLGSLIAIPYSYVNPMDFIQTNVIGTANLLNACLAGDVAKIVHTSTSEVYGTACYVPIDEKHPLQGQSPYSATKIAADKLAESYYRSFGLPVATVRPFNTFGPRQSTRAIIPTIILQALEDNVLHLGDLHPTRDLMFVDDTVNGFISVAESGDSTGEVINLGSGREISIGGLAETILAIMGKESEIRRDEQRTRPQNSEVERLLCDNDKAKQLLGWEPKFSLEEGLRKTVEWFEANDETYMENFAI